MGEIIEAFATLIVGVVRLLIALFVLIGEVLAIIADFVVALLTTRRAQRPVVQVGRSSAETPPEER